MNALELTHELKACTDLSDSDAAGLAHVISLAVDGARLGPLTRDHFDSKTLLTREHFDRHMKLLRSDLDGRMGLLRTASNTLALRSDAPSQWGSLSDELMACRAEIKADFASLRVELRQTIKAQTVRIISAMLAMAALTVAGIKLIH